MNKNKAGTLCLMLLVSLSVSIANSYGDDANLHKVKLTDGVQGKFKHVDLVLNQLIRTMEDPKVWGAAWNQKVPSTGTLRNYTVGQLVEQYKNYLTNGSLTIGFRPDPKATNFAAAASTVRNKIALNMLAGNADRQGYSDYKLAKTIFHELTHNWQYHNWKITGENQPFMPWDKERPAYDIEKYLPRNFFDTTLYPDPKDMNPLPPTGEDAPDALWRNAVGKWKNSTGTVLQIYEHSPGRLMCTIAELGSGLKGYQWAKDDVSFSDAYPIKGNTLRSEHLHVVPAEGDTVKPRVYKNGIATLVVKDKNSFTITMRGIKYSPSEQKWHPEATFTRSEEYRRVPE